MGIAGAEAEAFWIAVRGNLNKMADAREWADVCFGSIAPVREDVDFLVAAAALLPAEPFGPLAWKEWTDGVKAQTGRKGKTLFHPLRLALTGRENGPELAALLPLIGRARALDRLGAGA